MIVFVLIKNYKKNRKITPGKETLRIPLRGDRVWAMCSPLALFIINYYKIRNACEPLKNMITNLTIYWKI